MKYTLELYHLIAIDEKLMPHGAFLIIIAMSLTPAADGLAKVMAQDYSAFFVAFARYFSAGLLALMLAYGTGRRVHIPRKDRPGQVLRTAILAGAMTSLIAALSMVPFANAVGGFLIAPVVATVLCVVFFGERLSPARILGCAISLLGAILITKPSAVFEPGSLLALLGGALLGAYFAATRGMKDDSDVLSALAVQCLLASALLAPFAFAGGLPPYSEILIPGILGLGALSAIAHFLTVAAFRKSDASLLSPFMYFNLISALVFGYVFFSELPNLVSFIGLVAIGVGGLISALPAKRLALRTFQIDFSKPPHFRHKTKVTLS